MRKIVFFALVALFSCKSKSKEPTKEERINQIAAPLIANEVGDLNILINAVRDDNRPDKERLKAVSLLMEKFPGYMYHLSEFQTPPKKKKKESIEETVKHITDPDYVPEGTKEFLDSLKSPLATYWFNQQRKLIEDKYHKYAEEVVYKQDLQKQYESK